jgi:dCTP deaminase
MLSDGTIRRLVEQDVIGFSPTLYDHQFQPASIDLRLGHQFRVMEGGDDGNTIYTLPRQIGPDQSIHSQMIVPGVPVLAHTLEEIWLPNHIVARVEGKSSWGRKFLMVHMTAGFIDPGFRGQITLEILNLSKHPIELFPGDMICQISFETLDQPCTRPYGTKTLQSRYQGQRGPIPAVEREQRSTWINQAVGQGVMLKPEDMDLPAVKYDGGPVFPGDLLTNDGSTIE